MAVRVLGQKIKSESETDEEKKKRFLCKGLRDKRRDSVVVFYTIFFFICLLHTLSFDFVEEHLIFIFILLKSI